MRSPALLALACSLSLALACLPVASSAPSDPQPGGGAGGSSIDPLGDDGSLPDPVASDAAPSGWGSWDTSTWEPADAAAPADASSAPPEAAAAVDAAQDGDLEASADAAAPDAGVDAAGCTEPLAPGALVIDELMIASMAGSSDYGEWLEVRSTAPCALNLRGLRAEAPVGSKVISLEVGGDLWLPALSSFVIADSSNSATNHALPGPLLAWSGQPGDALRNEGGTITLSAGGAIVDSLTFPSLKLQDGASVAFPSDCPLARRSDWTAWQFSTASWFPAFRGTPNAPNADVHCPP